jgi:hypothetical protein
MSAGNSTLTTNCDGRLTANLEDSCVSVNQEQTETCGSLSTFVDQSEFIERLQPPNSK